MDANSNGLNQIDPEVLKALCAFLGRVGASGGWLAHEVICPPSESTDQDEQDAHLVASRDLLKKQLAALRAIETTLESSLELVRQQCDSRRLSGTINGLPTEMLLRIFNMIPDTDKLASPGTWTKNFVPLAHVSRRFRAIALKEIDFWGALSLKDSQLKVGWLLQHSMSANKGIAIDLAGYEGGQTTDHITVFMGRIVEQAHRWDMVRCDGNGTGFLMRWCPRHRLSMLTHFYFEPAGSSQDTPFFWSELQAPYEGGHPEQVLQQLQELPVAGVMMDVDPEHFNDAQQENPEEQRRRPIWIAPRLHTISLYNSTFNTPGLGLTSALTTFSFIWDNRSERKFDLYTSLSTLARVASPTLQDLTLHIATRKFCDVRFTNIFQGNSPRSRHIVFSALTVLKIILDIPLPYHTNTATFETSTTAFLHTFALLRVPQLTNLSIHCTSAYADASKLVLQYLGDLLSVRSFAYARVTPASGFGAIGSDFLGEVVRRMPVLEHFSFQGRHTLPPHLVLHGPAIPDYIWAQFPGLHSMEFRESMLVDEGYLELVIQKLKARASWNEFKKLVVRGCKSVGAVQAGRIKELLGDKEFEYSAEL